MKERFNLIALQVSIFTTVSPFATDHSHVLAMSGLLADLNLFHKVYRSCGAVGQLREHLSGCIIFFPLLLHVAEQVTGSCLVLISCPCMGRLGSAARGGRGPSCPQAGCSLGVQTVQAVQICLCFHTV